MQITINLIKTRDQKPPGDGYYIVCFQYGELLEVVQYKDGQWLNWTGERLIEPAFWAERPEIYLARSRHPADGATKEQNQRKTPIMTEKDWIQTKDKLPETSGWYIVSWLYNSQATTAYFQGGKWYSSPGNSPVSVPPIFWMDMPLAPKAPSEFEIFWEKCGHKIFVSTEHARQVFDIVRSFLDENDDRNPNREAK